MRTPAAHASARSGVVSMGRWRVRPSGDSGPMVNPFDAPMASDLGEVAHLGVQPGSRLGPQATDLAVANLEQFGDLGLSPAMVKAEGQRLSEVGRQPFHCL